MALPALVALCLLAASPSYESRYYRVSADSRNRAEALGRSMDVVAATYADLLTDNDAARRSILEAASDRKLQIVLYSNYREYSRHAPAETGAYYDGARLVGFDDPGRMLAYFSHEGMHQFTDLAAGGTARYPIWYLEGVADCVGNGEIRDGRLWIAREDGVLARMRLPVIQPALRDGRAWPLERLLSMDRAEFMRNASLGYAEAWSFCHFLLCAPDHGAGDRPAPDGRYRWNLSMFHSTIASGGAAADAARNAFARTERGEPLGLDRLQREWESWVRDYPALPPPGP